MHVLSTRHFIGARLRALVSGKRTHGLGVSQVVACVPVRGSVGELTPCTPEYEDIINTDQPAMIERSVS